MVFFFFSSRRRHTRWPRDWSSDVCSSDLLGGEALQGQTQVGKVSREKLKNQGPEAGKDHLIGLATARSEGTEESAVEAVSAAIDGFAETAEIGRASCRERVESGGVEGAGETTR